jgi:hypothetical protein
MVKKKNERIQKKKIDMCMCVHVYIHACLSENWPKKRNIHPNGRETSAPPPPPSMLHDMCRKARRKGGEKGMGQEIKEGLGK